MPACSIPSTSGPATTGNGQLRDPLVSFQELSSIGAGLRPAFSRRSDWMTLSIQGSAGLGTILQWNAEAHLRPVHDLGSTWRWNNGAVAIFRRRRTR